MLCLSLHKVTGPYPVGQINNQCHPGRHGFPVTAGSAPTYTDTLVLECTVSLFFYFFSAPLYSLSSTVMKQEKPHQTLVHLLHFPASKIESQCVSVHHKLPILKHHYNSTEWKKPRGQIKNSHSKDKTTWILMNCKEQSYQTH